MTAAAAIESTQSRTQLHTYSNDKASQLRQLILMQRGFVQTLLTAPSPHQKEQNVTHKGKTET